MDIRQDGGTRRDISQVWYTLLSMCIACSAHLLPLLYMYTHPDPRWFPRPGLYGLSVTDDREMRLVPAAQSPAHDRSVDWRGEGGGGRAWVSVSGRGVFIGETFYKTD